MNASYFESVSDGNTVANTVGIAASLAGFVFILWLMAIFQRNVGHVMCKNSQTISNTPNSRKGIQFQYYKM